MQPRSVVDILMSQMTEVAKAKKEGTSTTADAFSTSNFLRQFRDNDSREIQQLSAAQFMKVWEHYDEDGKFIYGNDTIFMHTNIISRNQFI